MATQTIKPKKNSGPKFQEKCALCLSDKVVEFLDLGKQPLANKYPKPEQIAAEDFFPLKVLFCMQCKNVQLGTVVSRDRMFVDYYYLSSVNPGLVRYFERLAETFKDAKLVVDIGSNDGILLAPLKKLGVKAVGIEPSVNVSKIANDRGLTTITSFFNASAVKQVIKEFGKADVIVASSIFTHLEDPHTFIEDVKNLITDTGSFIIEVEYIRNFLKDVQFERFYLDRVFYYSVTSLRDLFEKHGMRVVEVEEIEPHGGSIKVTAEKKEFARSPSARVVRLLEEEKTALDIPVLTEFRRTVESYIAAFRAKLEEYKKAGLRVAGYGAPARVATITNFGHIGPELVEFLVDDSPLKQNRFSPGMHIPIVSKEHLEGNKPDVLVVFAYEYFDDIKKKTGGGYRYLIAIPPREVK